MNVFNRNDIFPSWWANSVQKYLSVLAANFQLVKQDATHVMVPAGAGDLAAVVGIQGRWRWSEANVTRAHPGGSSGTYDIFAVAANNKISSTPAPGTDETVYTFELRVLKAGETPTIAPGTLDIYRKIGSCVWNGTEITRVDQLIPAVASHATRHAVGGADPLSPSDISAAGFSTGTLAARPAAGKPGWIYRATDNGIVYRDNGASWDATEWPGRLQPSASGTVPDGWLACEGQAVSRTTYALLFAAIGVFYGPGDGTNTFNLPDHRERVLVGAGGSLGGRGASGGATSVTLTAAQSGLPAHVHDLEAFAKGGEPPSTEASGGKNVVRGDTAGGGSGKGLTMTTVGSFSFGVGVGGVAGGALPASASHTNLQPYLVCAMWIKT